MKDRPPASVPGREGAFGAVVDALYEANEAFMARRPRRRGWHGLPSRQAMAEIFEDLRAILFPRHFGSPDVTRDGLRYALGARLDQARRLLNAQVRRGLSYSCQHDGANDEICEACDTEAMETTSHLLASLPRIRQVLGTDIQAAYDGDPAAKFLDETLFCYPGVTALIGSGAIIGCNVWLTHSVPPGARFTQSQEPARSDGTG